MQNKLSSMHAGKGVHFWMHSKFLFIIFEKCYLSYFLSYCTKPFIMNMKPIGCHIKIVRLNCYFIAKDYTVVNFLFVEIKHSYEKAIMFWKKTKSQTKVKHIHMTGICLY